MAEPSVANIAPSGYTFSAQVNFSALTRAAPGFGSRAAGVVYAVLPTARSALAILSGENSGRKHRYRFA